LLEKNGDIIESIVENWKWYKPVKKWNLYKFHLFRFSFLYQYEKNKVKNKDIVWYNTTSNHISEIDFC
jgi:hypothetical protein